MTPTIQTHKLNDGTSIPALGFGTWKAEPGEVGQAVTKAIEAGYTYLDLAKNYGNQEEVGEGIKAGLKSTGKTRAELYILSKLWNTQHKPELVVPAIKDTLKELGLEQLDMWLIHWPVSFDAEGAGKDPHKDLMPTKDDDKKVLLDTKTTLVDTWQGMIEAQKLGLTKSIGVSNMSPSHIEALIAATGVAPAVNEIERHARLQQPESIAAFKKQGVHVIGYSPLGAVYDEDKQVKDDPVVKRIADKHGTQPASVLIAWQLATGFSVIPKSTTPERIVSNLEAANVKLDEDDLNAIEALGKDYTRFNIPYTYEPQWDINVFGEPEEKDAVEDVKF